MVFFQISRLEVSDEEWQAELAESFAESGLLNSENSILTQVPRGLVNINFDTHACVHMGKMLGTLLVPQISLFDIVFQEPI